MFATQYACRWGMAKVEGDDAATHDDSDNIDEDDDNDDYDDFMIDDDMAS
jgi:hypothetical protein